MNEVFLDASFFVALINRHDEHHEKAQRFAEANRNRSVTTAWVLSEVGNYFARAVHRRLFLELMELLEASDDIAVISASEENFDAGFDLYARRLDKDWSLVDCISFAIMQERGIADALTADHHFEQAGFRILLK